MSIRLTQSAPMATKFNPLDPESKRAYDACADELNKLTKSQRYLVLKEIAMRLERDVVKQGAIRTAVVSAVSRTGNIPTSQGKQGGPSSSKKRAAERESKALYEEFLNTEEGKTLREAQQRLKSELSKAPTKNPELIAEVSKASRNLREAYGTFRNSKAKPTVESKTPENVSGGFVPPKGAGSRKEPKA